eukprot:Anaeramoba_ignava/a97953_20.p2 GENE.a97953_20~~a97953_20.p2  ORF type:complete len:105 (+),score=11.81 a97953_20:483-797(+)
MNILLMATQGGEAGGFGAFLPLLLIIVVFYFFMIRPQMKRQKETRKFRESLQKGDKVLTIGGIYGKISEVKDTYILLEIGGDVKVRVDKSAIVKDTTDITNAAK